MKPAKMQNGLVDDTQLVILESDHLVVSVAPRVGGKITSLRHKPTGHEFLWRNTSLWLTPCPPGSAYDPNFYGGIDEILPGDVPERVDGVPYPDHGELWTLSLSATASGDGLHCSGLLPLSGLQYGRHMSLDAASPRVFFDYVITNTADAERHFLWKPHAALRIAEGDVIQCPARFACVADSAWSRYSDAAPFLWPMVDGTRVDTVPGNIGATDFFFLYDLERGELAWHRPSSNLTFRYTFDMAVFPYACFFASYGGFYGHYTMVIEPCSAMPLSVNEARARGQCTRLAPGESLRTRLELFAGRNEEA